MLLQDLSIFPAIQGPPPHSVNPPTVFHMSNTFKILTKTTNKTIHHTASNYITNLVLKYHSNPALHFSQDLLPSSSLIISVFRTSPKPFPSSGTSYTDRYDYLSLCPPLDDP
ncbi:hypothetical protein AB205_0193200 [Aquarana catesbeiana]|uniref:Uncharacterized protein n=1 Tax=Aquarana catesbeiana TaxID=8400 RepID=A0A2G9RR25_AQUCT|nr:hypothetical protein AB205_0193200 [Aquarana catesbeiana]